MASITLVTTLRELSYHFHDDEDEDSAHVDALTTTDESTLHHTSFVIYNMYYVNFRI